MAIVEDHRLLAQLMTTELLRRGVTAIVIGLDGDIELSLDEAVPDLILLDIELGQCGADSLALCRRFASTVDVVILTGVGDPVTLARYLEAGALGVVSKAQDLEASMLQVIGALEGHPIGPSPADRMRMLDGLRRCREERKAALDPFRTLSDSEADVLAMLLGGSSVAEIAGRRVVSLTTVRTQVRAIHRKLGVATQLEAVALANRAGWDRDAT